MAPVYESKKRKLYEEKNLLRNDVDYRFADENMAVQSKIYKMMKWGNIDHDSSDLSSEQVYGSHDTSFPF